jgi:hypothetical protein
MKIAENNFLEPHELVQKEQTDPGSLVFVLCGASIAYPSVSTSYTRAGYFGKGIYFTQFPSYGTSLE